MYCQLIFRNFQRSNMDTPQKQVLEYLKTGKDLTVCSCRELFHTTELRRIVSRLRQDGHNITGFMTKDLDGHRFKRYFLLK